MKAAVVPSCVSTFDEITFRSALCRKFVVAALVFLLASFANLSTAFAACANPAGTEGEMIYNDAYNVAQFCNGSDWVSMSGGASAGAESDPQVGATTLNKWCRGDGSGVVCDQDTPSVTETDPEVGTLTASKWCTTNGTLVECTSDLPIGTLTNGKWCTTNGTTVSCTSDAPTATAGADTQVIFNDAGALSGDASFVWDKTNNRLGIGNTPSTELEVTGTVKASGPFWSAFGAAGTHRGLLLENFDNTAVAHGVDMAAKLGGTEFQGLSWVKETAWLSGDAAGSKDAMLQLGVLLDNTPSVPMVIRADGKVGIGTANPSYPLEVTDAIAINAGTTGRPWIYLNASGTNANKNRIRYTGTQWFALRDDTAAVDRLTIDSAGNVGIGTTSPSKKLHIHDNNTSEVATELLRLDNPSLNATNNGMSIGFYQGAVQYARIRSFYTAANGWTLNMGYGPGDHLTINSSGSVGIGTATANVSALLDVSSTTKGFLPPRMTTAARNAIATPTDGLTVYNTTTDGLETYSNGFWQTGAALRNVGRGTSGDYNTIIQNTPGGIWWMDGPGSPNGPTGTNTGTLVHLDPLWNQGASANQYAIQLATNGNAGDKLYFRHQYGGTWGNWVDLTATGGGGTPGGATTNVQFNSSGSFGGDASFVWDNTNKRLGIGTTSPDEKLDVNGLIVGGFGAASTAGTLDWNHSSNARSGNGSSLLLGNATNGPGGGFYYHPFTFEYSNKDGTGNMSQLAVSYGNDANAFNNGAMFIRGRYSGVWTGWYKFTTAAVSDYRAKEDVRPLEGGLNEVMRLHPVRFNYKAGKGPDGAQEGFIAHELQKVAPYSVTGEKDAIDAAGNPLLQSVDLARLTPLLAAAIQDLKAANDNLRAENSELRTGLEDLRREVDALKAASE